MIIFLVGDVPFVGVESRDLIRETFGILDS